MKLIGYIHPGYTTWNIRTPGISGLLEYQDSWNKNPTDQKLKWYQSDQPTTRRLPSLYMGLKSRMGTHKKLDAKQVQEVKVSSPILSEDDFIGPLFGSSIRITFSNRF